MSINTGAISPGTMADDATVGTVAWSNPDNAKVSDNSYATVTKTISGSAIAHYLKATNFGFSIPTGATINGILVGIEVKCDRDLQTSFDNCRIIKSDGSIGTTNKISGPVRATDTYLPLPSNSSSTDLWGETWTPADINDADFGIAISSMVFYPYVNYVDHIRITVYYTAPPTVTTQAVSAITSHTATGNGTVVSDGGATITERGICWKTSTGPTTADSKATSTGTTGAYTASLTGLLRNTLYYVRAYAINSIGTSYGAEETFTTIQFTNPQNIYSSNNVYATLAATSGILTVEVSKDAGVNWQTPKTVTFTASDSLQTVGLGATELFGSSFTRADMVDANFRIRLSQGNISQVYKNFGFTTDSDILTGIEIAIEGNYASSTISLDLLEVKIHYGTSILPVQAGSQAFASDGRKAGEGAGSGTGLLVYYDGSDWIASDTGVPVAA